MSERKDSLVDILSDMKARGASDREVRKGFNRYMETVARQKRIPLHGSFELTPLCNLDCKMCYVHLNGASFGSDRLIPVDRWKGLILEAHRAGMLYASLTGGECLTYPGFDELYLSLREAGVMPAILTNGLLLDEKRIEFFKKYPPSMIQVTLYGSSEDAYERVTGHRVFGRICHNIEMLRQARLRAHLAITPSAYMKDDARPLLETAKALGLPFGINAHLIPPREETGRALDDLSVGGYVEMYRAMKAQRGEELTPVDPVELPDVGGGAKEAYGFQCGGGRSAFAIQYDGAMSPCSSMGEIRTYPVEEGFLNAWHRLNALVDAYPMPAECTGCAYKYNCLYCPAVHKNARPGHCDPQICERTKRLIREGFMPLPGSDPESVSQ